MGAFAVELFGLIVGEHPGACVDLRIAAPFSRLLHRGYVGLLVASGWRVLAFGARHGVRTLGQLRQLVEKLTTRPAEPWERDAGDSPDGDLRPSAR